MLIETTFLLSTFVFVCMALILVNFSLRKKLSLLQEEISSSNKIRLRELRRIRKKAINESKVSTIATIVRGLGHEINNPLAIITGYSTSLQKSAERDQLQTEKVKKSMRRILNSTSRITAIMNTLRSFSNSNLDGKKGNVTWKRIVDEILDVKKADLEGINIKVFGDMELTIGCKYDLLTQAILNLISNSIKALRKSNQEDMWIELDCRLDGVNYIVSVTDSGTGISKEIVDKIMEPFFTTSSPEEGGTGLGLSLSRQIIELGHNGKIRVDRLCKNTRFIMSFPI
jgi:two-component system, LuxR family, sensor histidine kinase DctS